MASKFCDVCARAKMDTRVLILTARGEVSDRVTGLGLGADDYLAKPFAMQELVARVSALGRRFPEKAPIEAPSRRFGFEPGGQSTVPAARAGSSFRRENSRCCAC